MKGLIAVIASWLLMNLIYAIFTAMKYGRTAESGMILFWSGIYILLSWVVFILVPKVLISRLRFGKLINFASPIMGLYAGVVFTMLFGWEFEFGETFYFYLPYAIITGLIYGLLLTAFKVTKWRKKATLLLIPTLGIGFYVLFPIILPSHAFRFMPDKTQDKIISKIIPKLKVGDSNRLIQKKLPNAFYSPKSSTLENDGVVQEHEIDDNDSRMLSYSNEFISFNIKVENGIITKLNYYLIE